MKVVLYDTRDRRGWLVDGASTLLHITCTQLCSSPYAESDLLRMGNFIHADPIGGALASKKALMETKNRVLPIFDNVSVTVESRAGNIHHTWAETTTTTRISWTYEDLVRQTYHVMEQMHDYERCLKPQQRHNLISQRGEVSPDLRLWTL